MKRINALMKEARGGILTRDDELDILELLQSRAYERFGAKVERAHERARQEGIGDPETLKQRVKALLSEECGRPLDELEQGTVDDIVECESPEFQAAFDAEEPGPAERARTRESLRRVHERLDLIAALRQQQYLVCRKLEQSAP